MVFLVTVIACTLIPRGLTADQLAPGNHSTALKSWGNPPMRVENYTPLDLNAPITALTVGEMQDLWFALGPSLEHIDELGKLTAIRMPEYLWSVRDISLVRGRLWFSLGQSGKVGILEGSQTPRFVQVVPRRFFPDLRDVAIDGSGAIWFADVGRMSLGYRSPSGTVTEHPLPPGTWPRRLRRCLGRTWVSLGPGMFGVMDRPGRFHRAPLLPGIGTIVDLACDRSRLWLAIEDRRQSAVGMLDSDLHLRIFAVPPGQYRRVAPDHDGGVWSTAMTPFPGPPKVMISHIAGTSTTTTTLRTPPVFVTNLASDPIGTLWLAFNAGGSPVSILRIYPPRAAHRVPPNPTRTDLHGNF